jgi:hypothetical protein
MENELAVSDVGRKWGKAVASRGFAQIPNHLLLLNVFLQDESKLSPVELLVLIQLAGAWWKKDDMPFPSMRTLSLRCSVSERQIQRAVSSLISKNIIGRVKRRTKGIIASNAYDMTPLVDLLNEIAKQFPNEYPRQAYLIRLKSGSGQAAAEGDEE